MNDDRMMIAFCALAGFIIVAGTIALTVVSSHYEAKTFNRCTGGHVTLTDALFTELRVTDCE